MKYYINICLCLLLLNLTACEDWLDLQPESESTEDQVFSTGEGYRSVLNGLYAAMGSSNLYGREMSWGVLDCLSQQYNFDGGKELCYWALYPDAASFKYMDNTVAGVIDAIWLDGFNIVANANNLIQNVEKASADLFERKEMERKMIMGEAYACRALIQFDLLRLFAPALVNDDGANYVPYLETYPNIQANGIAVKPYLDKVIADLEKAQGLVMEFDTSTLGKVVSANGKARFWGTYPTNMGIKVTNDDYFFAGRGFRLNYYSISALLARVYQYAGRHEDAFKLAEKVVNFKVQSGTASYSLYEDDYYNIALNSFDKRTDAKVISNLIFAVYNEKAYEENNLQLYFKKQSDNVTSNWLIINRDVQKIFYTSNGTDESQKDFRSKYMIYLANGKYPLSAKWYLSEDAEIRDKNVTIQPMIRTTEMQYIMAEYYAREGLFSEAKKLLVKVREARGCTADIVVNSWDTFVDELVRDARREWISEGQLFYLYKRLNAAVDFGSKGKRPLERKEYLVPIPSNQSL